MSATPARFDTEAMLADLERLVNCESPSNDQAALQRSADEVAALGARLLGAEPVRHGIHLHWTFGTPRVLLLGHHDTVWPLGTLARWPMTRDGDRVTGPGCYDMKAGIVLAMHAAAALESLDGVSIFLTGDEEIGAPTSKALIVEAAAGLDATLVTEPCVGSTVKVARKGIRNMRITVTGRASHAGLEPEKGVNAAVELARHLVEVESWARPDGLSLVPTLVTAGTTMNTVPAAATATFDMRGWLESDLDAMEARMMALAPHDPDARLAVEVTHGRGPLEDSASTDLYELAQDVTAQLRHPPLAAARVGGVSDGNFTAAAGIPTLDGLGASGDGAHAEGEWIDVSTLATRAQLLQGMLEHLLADRDALGGAAAA